MRNTERCEVICAGVMERVQHAHTFHGFLRRAVDDLGFWQSGRFKDGRGDIDEVMVLCADFTFRLDHLRPMNNDAIGGAAVRRVALQ